MQRETCQEWDQNDPLGDFREAFVLPEGCIYLDGNSLGACPKAVPQRAQQVIEQEWARDLIKSWNMADWIGISERVGEKIGRLIGAQPGETRIADSTSLNLFKVLAVALQLQTQRKIILTQTDNFPTDIYMAQGLATFMQQQHQVQLLPASPSEDEILAAINDQVAVLLLTQVNYRTGELHDMARITQKAHEAGVLVIWDLAHSTGVLPVDLNAVNADFAVGCGYKYLNGGPGAPAFVWVAQRHLNTCQQPLSGWIGHAAPFAFEPDYRGAEGIDQFLCGTPSVIASSVLECGVDLLLQAPMSAIREKSQRLTQLFMDEVERVCSELQRVSPSDADRRGSQVSFAHPSGYAIMQALIQKGVIGDYRHPNVMRFGFAPLYIGYCDVWDAVQCLRSVLDSQDWQTGATDVLRVT